MKNAKKSQKNEFCCRVGSTCMYAPGVCIVKINVSFHRGAVFMHFYRWSLWIFFIVNMHKKWTRPIAVNMHTKCNKKAKHMRFAADAYQPFKSHSASFSLYPLVFFFNTTLYPLAGICTLFLQRQKNEFCCRRVSTFFRTHTFTPSPGVEKWWKVM